ncbi:MAG: FliM/FliN family flagellar motor switch protein [Alphaproteobacteria bacterium]|nr:MAG: FliM/FliN family flagellar motor switch protein [Alphaproteobacteria bacterium]
MTSQSSEKVIRRKLRPPAGGRGGAEAPSPVAATLVRALARAAQDLAGLALRAKPPAERRCGLEDLVADVPEGALVALVARYGLVVLDRHLVAAIVGMQTAGRIPSADTPPRAPTRTDAAMCADVIDGMLELLDSRLAGDSIPDAEMFRAFRFAYHLPDAEAAGRELEPADYREIAFDLALGGAGHGARLRLAVPEPRPDARDVGEAAPSFHEALRAHVLESEARLTAVLARQTMTLAALEALAPGDVLPLPDGALDGVRLEDLAGELVATGRLGKSGGHRALRLTHLGKREPAPRMPVEARKPQALENLAPGARSGAGPSAADMAQPPPAADLGETLGASPGQESFGLDPSPIPIEPASAEG